MKKFLGERLAKDIMTGKVFYVEKGTPVHDIFRIFMENNIMGVPVVDRDKKVIGIVTERDLAVREEDVEPPAAVNLLGSVIYLGDMEKYKGKLKKKLGQLAADVMTSPALTLREDATMAEILEFMERHGVNRVPIVDNRDMLCGIVTRTDIIKEMIKEGRDN
jgi:CBS domain-containing protein